MDYVNSGFPHELYVSDVIHGPNFESRTVIKCDGCDEVALIDRVSLGTMDFAALEELHQATKTS